MTNNQSLRPKGIKSALSLTYYDRSREIGCLNHQLPSSLPVHCACILLTIHPALKSCATDLMQPGKVNFHSLN
jgi:hypothetical protein